MRTLTHKQEVQICLVCLIGLLLTGTVLIAVSGTASIIVGMLMLVFWIAVGYFAVRFVYRRS